MIILVLRMTVQRDRQDEFLRSMEEMMALTSSEPGCVDCHMYESNEEENTYVLVEEWESGVHLDWHIHRDTFKSLLRIRDLAEGRPVVKVFPAFMKKSRDTRCAS